jgi:hypothetical protein
LPIRQAPRPDQAFAEALDDPRYPDLTEPTFLEVVRSRVHGILAGYADQNGHDTLRADPAFRLVADLSPGEGDLASQPSLSRFENAISIQSLRRLPWAGGSRTPAACRRVRAPRPCQHVG